MLGEYHGEVVEESQHEHLEEIHQHKQLEVSVDQDLPRHRLQHGEGAPSLSRTSLVAVPRAIRGFVIKAALAVQARVDHAAAAQNGNQHSENLEIFKTFHVFGHHATEEDAGGPDERGHLRNKET